MANSQADAADRKWAGVVLAAGRGSRMGTSLPKVLHAVGGLSMIRRVLDSLSGAALSDVSIVRDDSGALPEALGLIYPYVAQSSPSGTGGALAAYLNEAAPGAAHLLVINADLPLITADSLIRLKDAHESRSDVAVTFFTMLTSNNTDYGRLLRSKDGNVAEIVEAGDPRHTDSPAEGNAGVYALDFEWAKSAVGRIPQHENGEYFITDLVALAVSDGRGVEAVSIDAEEAIGVNTLVNLAEAERVAWRRTLEALMLSGVTIVDPSSTYIDSTVTIAANTVIRPNTHITGTSVIGEGCEIGPDAHIVESVIGEGCVVQGSWLDEVTLEDGVSVGPFARLRPGTYIGREAHIGSFGEIKASRIGSRTAMGHFGYVGDADVGDDVNIGAGAVTCNYDGQEKHRTVVGDGAFIGSGSLLVAPVEVGSKAYTAAGAVVTRNVAAGTTVAGVPAEYMRR